MKRIYELQVPIPNYYGDEIFHQSLFLSSKSCPLASDWYSYAEELHLRDSQYPEYIGDFLHAMQAIEIACKNNEFPLLYGNCVSTNGIIPTDFGPSSITLSIVPVKEIK